MDREKKKTTDDQTIHQEGSSKPSAADRTFTDKDRKLSEKDQHTRGGF
ncbi:hypothetical protein ACFFJF_00545 [Allobacillus sp. GCM10007489]|nr:hypothetical protein [Allobacillus sp. SKP2-8]